MTDQELLPVKLAKLQQKALLVAIVALGLFGAYAFLMGRGDTYTTKSFFQSYLIGFFFALAGGLGSLVWLCIIHLAGGKWGYCIRRLLEAGTKTIPWMFLLFLPILFFGQDLYPWWVDDPSTIVDPHGLIALKLKWLNPSGFAIRAVIYFAIWFGLSWRLTSWSKQQDEVGGIEHRNKMKALSGPAIILYILALTGAAVDWSMSITPEWFSSIYGVMFAIGQGLTVLGFCCIMMVWLSKLQPLKTSFTVKQQHDLGKLLFAFVVLWAYIEVSQLIIIWSGNLPEETPWYINRMSGPLTPLTIFVFLFHFFVPFALLLSRHSKRKKSILPKIAFALICMRAVDLYWIIAPSVHQPMFHSSGLPVFHWSDVFAPIGFGALFVALCIHYYRKLPILPLKDPVFTESYDYKKEAA
jgi:hypothetical protein